jgi:hypothetical protein
MDSLTEHHQTLLMSKNSATLEALKDLMPYEAQPEESVTREDSVWEAAPSKISYNLLPSISDCTINTAYAYTAVDQQLLQQCSHLF